MSEQPATAHPTTAQPTAAQATTDREPGTDQPSIRPLAGTGPPLASDALAERYLVPDRSAPWLRVNFVASVDGAMEVDGLTAGLSSPADRHLFLTLRMLCDAVLVGAQTLRQENYGPARMDERRQAWRAARGLAPHPALVVVSRSLDLDPHRPSFADAPVRPVVLTPQSAPAARREALAATTDVITVGADTVELPDALSLLHRRGLRHLLCEGGPHLFGELTAADLVDEVCLTVSPVLAGPGADRITAGPVSPVRAMRLHRVLTGDGALFLSYRRVR